LADIVDAHLTRVIGQGMDRTEAGKTRYPKMLRSYTKLVDLVEARDREGAEKHWRRHMEVAAQYIVLNDDKNMPLVDLFG